MADKEPQVPPATGSQKSPETVSPTKNKRTQLAAYWGGIHTALQGRLDSVREYLRHPSSGVNAEDYFRDLLRAYLPSRFAVESGFVVNEAGERSDFMDVLLVDCLHIPPLSAEPHFKVFPAEAVVGAIEITSALRTRVPRRGIPHKIEKLEDDVLKLAKLRQLARDRRYLDQIPVRNTTGQLSLEKIEITYALAPRSFVMTFGDEWQDVTTYKKHLTAALEGATSRNLGDVWVNAAFSMRHGMFHFVPHTSFTLNHITDNPLLEFILFIYQSISDFPISKIDLARYRPTLPEQPDDRPSIPPPATATP